MQTITPQCKNVALVNGFWHGAQNQLIYPNDKVLFQTDCLYGLETFKGLQPPGNEDEQLALDKFWEYIRHYQIQPMYRHVKGHTTRDESRYVTNRICDQKAKKHMRKMRRRLQLKEIRGDLA